MTEAPGDLLNPELPVVLDRIDIDGDTTQFRFAFEGRAYDVAGPKQSQPEFVQWLAEYAAKTPRCACCEKVIFPGQPVTLGHITPEDTGYSHFSPQCNDTAIGFAGSFNAEGELVNPPPLPPIKFDRPFETSLPGPVPDSTFLLNLMLEKHPPKVKKANSR